MLNKRFDVATVTRVANRLLHGTDSGVFGLLHKWDNEDLRNDVKRQIELANDFLDLLTVRPSLPVMLSSISSLFTEPINQKLFEFVCWRIAANLDNFRLNEVIPPWQGLVKPILAPLQIVHVKVGWSRHKEPKLGFIVTFKVIAGEACPVVFEKWFSSKFLFVMAKDIGILQPSSKYKYTAPNDLYGMRLLAVLVKSKTDAKAVDIDRFAIGQFKNRNQTLIRLRYDPCPKGFKFPCNKCPLGENDCPVKTPISRACRLVSLTVRSCKVCDKQTPHDGGFCVACRRRHPCIGTTNAANTTT